MLNASLSIKPRMKKSFSLFSSILLGLMAMMSLPVLAQSQGEEPIITFHTTVYDDSKGASPKVSFSLGAVEKDVPVDIDCGFGKDFLEVGFARLSEQNVQGTDYASTVSSKGVVKI